MPINLYLKSEDDTISLAESLAPHVSIGTIILLSGPLGSGKTFFTTALCSFLGVKETVNSPSFVLVNNYQADRFPIYHIDLYRLTNTEEALDLGIEEFCEEGVVVIEWPQLLAGFFDNQKNLFELDFNYCNQTRTVTVTLPEKVNIDISS